MSLFRIDRFLTVNIFSPLLRVFSNNGETQIPILMYHSISDDKMEGKHPYFETNTSLAVFSEHMKHLHENQYEVVNLDDVVEQLKIEKNYPNKPVVITFDDGFRDIYTNAFPVLQEYSFPATVFLPTAFIENKRKKFVGKECLTWDEVIEMSRNGILFGSHTVNHPKLISLSIEDIKYELHESKEEIEKNIEKRIETFSYPYAFPEGNKVFIHNLDSIARGCKYKIMVTTKIGSLKTGSSSFCLKRIPMNNYDDLRLFDAKIKGQYNWVGFVQSYFKAIKNVINTDSY
ncbi:MAG: Polysaccharide deacetylase [Candidatus Argoarchaeum ethanivorans]|uniref:Polysaccharide deacetylase n=1 Tax=Candidatus Argoarchaeum ethanivorans TaxID=2608793 RepID=A0A812A1A6_9EURY|nr:MAG: Polysaccharide deacetylase [Candidatus Argoarchaeum ethanivorans]